MTALVLVLTFIASGSLAAMVLLALTAQQRAVEARLDAISAPEEQAPSQAHERADLFPTVSRLLAGWGKLEPLQLALVRAGLPVKPSEFLVLVLVGTVAITSLVWLLLHVLALTILAALVCPLLAYMIVSMLRTSRQRLMEQQLSEALVLIASSLRSGYSVLRSIQTVSQEMAPPIANEFGQVAQEVSLGLPMEDALRHLALRVPSYDVQLMVTAITIQLEVGGNLASILETLAATIRERNRIRAEIAALTAEGRLSGIILLALPVIMALLIFVLNRPYLMPLVTTTFGQALVVVGVCLQLAGALVIKRMLDMDF